MWNLKDTQMIVYDGVGGSGDGELIFLIKLYLCDKLPMSIAFQLGLC